MTIHRDKNCYLSEFKWLQKFGPSYSVKSENVSVFLKLNYKKLILTFNTVHFYVINSDHGIKKPLRVLSHTFRPMSHSKISHCDSFFIPGNRESGGRTCELHQYGLLLCFVIYNLLGSR